MTSITRFASAIALLMLTLPTVVSAADPFQPDIAARDLAQFDQAAELRRQGKLDKAIPMLEELTARNPDYYRAQSSLALAYAETKHYDKAEARFKSAAQLQKKLHITDPTLFNSFGWMSLVNGDYKTAEVQFQNAERDFDKLSPDSKRKLLNNTGLLYMYKQNYPKANVYLERAAKEFDSDLAKENLKTLEVLKARTAKAQ